MANEKLASITNKLIANGGTPYLVGGCVRDEILGVESKDIDVEVYGLPFNNLVELLGEFGRCSVHGESFRVVQLKVDGIDESIDFSLPRREVKKGSGHKGFEIISDSSMSIEEASLRRDFTINAMMKNLVIDELVDLHGGKEDLRARKLKAVSDRFSEDPLRVLRGMQFAARFDMSMDSETAALCRSLIVEFDTLPKERIWLEWEKVFTKGIKPSKALEVLKQTMWIKKFPAINDIDGVPQDPIWHPEGDVFVHTGHVLDYQNKICHREFIEGDDRLILMLSALAHDIGKPPCTELNDEGRITSKNHANIGADMTESFLENLGAPKSFLPYVKSLVKYHMVHYDGGASSRSVRRLARKLQPATIQSLCWLMEADVSGRPPLPQGMSESIKDLMQKSINVEVIERPADPIILGRHLIKKGLTPSIEFGKILSQCQEAQDNGDFIDEEAGLVFLDDLLESISSRQ